MESAISRLLKTYEDGKLTRRGLVQGLALLAAGTTPLRAAGFQGNGVNHVSLQVRDLQRSTEYYQRMLGATVQKREGNNALTIGKSRIVLRPGNPPGRVDHFAIGIDNFKQDAVVADLKARGVTPVVGGGDVGFHVVDPDGYPVQLIGNDAA